MKKVFIVAVLALFSLSAMAAQPYEKSIGLRLGSSIGATYKQFLSEKNAIEGILDLDLLDSDALKLNVTGLYLWEWNISGGWNWFAGPGASVGMRFGDNSGFNLGIDGMVGIEYKFDIPLVLGVDFNPRWYLIGGSSFGGGGALSVRYTF